MIFLGCYYATDTLHCCPEADGAETLSYYDEKGKERLLQGYTIGYKDGYIRMFSSRRTYKGFAKAVKTVPDMFTFLQTLSRFYGDK